MIALETQNTAPAETGRSGRAFILAAREATVARSGGPQTGQPFSASNLPVGDCPGGAWMTRRRRGLFTGGV